MPSDPDASQNPSQEPSSEGTPYRALLAEGGAFDVTLREQDGTLTLRAVPASDGDEAADEASPADSAEDDAPSEEPGEEVSYRFEQTDTGHALLVADGRSVPVTVTPSGAGEVRVTLGGQTRAVQVQDATDLLLERFGIAAGAGAAEAEVRAPMPGLVVRVLVEEGDEVEEGDGLLVLEAMKMENELRAPSAGTVAVLHAEEGASAGKGEVLVEIEQA